jgi:subtilase family serine protease
VHGLHVQRFLPVPALRALTGITVNFSSGDAGDHTAGGTDLAAKTVEFPADLPYVTGVGGTSVLIGGRGQWLGEHGWQSAYSTLTSGAWAPAPPGTYSSGGGCTVRVACRASPAS